MEQSGEHAIPASREVVWAALNDPDILRACIAGCETLTRTGEQAFAAQVKAKVGPMSATFKGTVTLVDLDPPAGYRMLIEAQGGGVGFGKGEAAVTLAETADGTLLRYSAQASVGGKLAQVGSRLVGAAMRQMAESFFAAFSERLRGAGDADAQAKSPATAATQPAPAAVGRARQLAFAVGIALLIAAIVAIFSGAGG